MLRYRASGLGFGVLRIGGLGLQFGFGSEGLLSVPQSIGKQIALE